MTVRHEAASCRLGPAMELYPESVCHYRESAESVEGAGVSSRVSIRAGGTPALPLE
jgi:hypothetical protein